VSVDFKREFTVRLLPFSEQHLKGKAVYLLDEPDHNSWISKVNGDWQGEIPATLIIRNQPSLYSFERRQFTFKELLATLKLYLKS
jgi:hypothetical protein